jgi:phospholipase/carboxylesterase
MQTGAPIVATAGSQDPDAPLVVLLHGRGASEQHLIGLAQHLPSDASYAAVRAPLGEGGGFAWFANRGIGRPVAESLEATTSWFERWLDEVAPAGRPVILVGFSGGAAFAGGLILRDPSRYAGAAILYGTLPFDAGIPVERGQLDRLPVFVAQGDQDHVIPAELLARTWTYLLAESGAPTTARRDPGGHDLTASTVQELASWIAYRFRTLATTEPRPARPSAWPTLPGGTLPERQGPSPQVSWTIPQQQETQNAPVQLQEALYASMLALPGVTAGASHISVPGARAVVLSEPGTDPTAFLVPQAGEFAHLHPSYDGSLHLTLPAELVTDLVTRGWGRPHPWAGTRLSAAFVMVYGPRDAAELDVVKAIVTASHAYAAGPA